MKYKLVPKKDERPGRPMRGRLPRSHPNPTVQGVFTLLLDNPALTKEQLLQVLHHCFLAGRQSVIPPPQRLK